MARPVTVNWDTVDQTPQSSALTQYSVSLTGTTTAQQFVPLGTLTVTFPSVDTGDYVAHVALANADGSVLEGEKTASFSVPATTMPFPNTVTVTLG